MSAERAILHLATVGLSEKDLAVLHSLLTLYSIRLDHEWRLSSDNDPADLHLIDIDDHLGESRWQSLRQSKRCVTYSNHASNSAITLAKPLRGSALMNLLNQFIPDTESVTIVNNQTSDSNGSKTLIEILESGTINTPVRLITPSHTPDLWIEPTLKQYVFDAQLEPLQNFLSQPFPLSQLVNISVDEFNEQARSIRPHTLTRLQWFSALACSNGELSHSIDLQTPFKLSAWPDMESHIPDYFRLAGFLVKNAATFSNLVEKTQVNPSLAADFVNACYRAGLLENQEATRTVSKFNFARVGIISRVRARLGI